MHSIWLTLDPVSERKVTALISSTAARFGCPSFTPHITLLGELEGTVDKSVNLIRDAFADVSAARLDVSNAKAGNTFFTSIILQAPLSKPLDNARTSLVNALTPDRFEQFNPHVSLAYGLADSTEKTAYITELLEGPTVDFIAVSGVAVVRSSKTTPIHEWSILSKLDLALPSSIFDFNEQNEQN